MASLLGTSSSAAAAAILASTPFSSRSSKSAVLSLFPSSGHSQGRKFYGGIRLPVKKGRSQFHVAISNVATEISPAQEQAQKLAEDSQRPVYPFPAIVGQDEMKLCLLLNVIDPKIGGVMIMGDRGTGKSTTVRSLVDLLPEIKVISGDPFNSDPEDQEVMSAEVRDKLRKGEQLPVSLTKINMVDLPLGNPEEGELRPQLLDRFGMHAQVGTVRDAELRVKIVEERGRFDKNPKEFRESYKGEQEKLQSQITSARSGLSSVTIDHDLRVKISKVCAELNVDGLRGDIVTNRAAKALAALKGRDKVTPEDIATVIPNCLRHRLRKDPLESIDSGLLVVEKFYEVFG
uniref:magnesium chelatase n=1 Tax=Solanum tuberosum TaxID=4113 RepID=M1CJ42_SOLTU